MKNIEIRDKYDHLRKSKLKLTESRMRILRLFSMGQPIDANYIVQKLGDHALKKAHALSTVYRTLDMLLEEGIIRIVDLRKAATFYELTEEFSGSHHHHLVCTSCGRTEDFEQCGITKIAANILKKSNFFEQINDHSLELFGLCKVCAKG